MPIKLYVFYWINIWKQKQTSKFLPEVQILLFVLFVSSLLPVVDDSKYEYPAAFSISFREIDNREYSFNAVTVCYDGVRIRGAVVVFPTCLQQTRGALCTMRIRWDGFAENTACFAGRSRGACMGREGPVQIPSREIKVERWYAGVALRGHARCEDNAREPSRRFDNRVAVLCLHRAIVVQESCKSIYSHVQNQLCFLS